MGKSKKELRYLSQIFTDIRALTVMNMCQILSLYPTANKNYGPKTVVTGQTEISINNISQIVRVGKCLMSGDHYLNHTSN